MEVSCRGEFVAGLATKISFSDFHIRKCVELLDAGNTVPFISRYRKDSTGGMDPETIFFIEEELGKYQALAKRRGEVLKLISKSAPEKLTDKLRQDILAAASLKRLEDLYLPFRPKKATRASQARARGLGPLLDALWAGRLPPGGLRAAARAHVRPGEEGLGGVDAVLEGVADLVAEALAEDAEAREAARGFLERGALVQGKGTKEERARAARSKYRDYLDFSRPARALRAHQTLALLRGEKEGALRVAVALQGDKEGGDAAAARLLQRFLPPGCPRQEAAVQKGAAEAWARLLRPSLGRALLRGLKEAAQEESARVFGDNLRAQLLAPPVRGRRILAVDPGHAHGCKLAALSRRGAVLALGVVYPLRDRARAKAEVAALVRGHGLAAAAVGNGVGAREAQQLLAELAQEDPSCGALETAVVSEAGASVYSASAAARAEFPGADPSALGAVSIGRRLLDPLSELVKIDPKALGVGLYQHDLGQAALARRLDHVVRGCVNEVGVMVNSASEHLLQYVSGLNKSLAKKIIEFRTENGPFATREDFKKIKGFGKKTFENAAGFLRIEDGNNFLDNTRVHPESYDVALKLLGAAGLLRGAPGGGGGGGGATALGTPAARAALEGLPLADSSSSLTDGAGGVLPFLLDPCPDPRTALPAPLFRKGVLKLEELRPGMKLQGAVRNIVPFGAFIDVGVGVDGLLHNSQLNRHMGKALAVGDILEVVVTELDCQRQRISLSNRPELLEVEECLVGNDAVVSHQSRRHQEISKLRYNNKHASCIMVAKGATKNDCGAMTTASMLSTDYGSGGIKKQNAANRIKKGMKNDEYENNNCHQKLKKRKGLQLKKDVHGPKRRKGLPTASNKKVN